MPPQPAPSASRHITVWALGLRIPTMKVPSAPKSGAYVQTGSKAFSRCLYASALTKCITGPKLKILSPSEKNKFIRHQSCSH